MSILVKITQNDRLRLGYEFIYKVINGRGIIRGKVSKELKRHFKFMIA